MSLKHLVIVTLLGSSSMALADTKAADADNQRKWTILASEHYAERGNALNKPVVTDPGVFVTAQRDPQNKK